MFYIGYTIYMGNVLKTNDFKVKGNKMNYDDIITVRIQNNYGVDTIYPVCDKAKLFAAIAGTKTLTADTLRHIKALKYTIQTESNL